jgi:hypothetical protein
MQSIIFTYLISHLSKPNKEFFSHENRYASGYDISVIYRLTGFELKLSLIRRISV